VNPFWLVSGLVLLVGGVAVVALLRGTAEEARLLVEELGRQRQVAESVRRLARETGGLRDVRRRALRARL
jgi:protein-S-isoprenylcysteine O-methyltransferase Ste14